MRANQNEETVFVRSECPKRHVFGHLAAWSSGMILVSGAGGRGFDSRSSPYIFDSINIDSITKCKFESQNSLLNYLYK